VHPKFWSQQTQTYHVWIFEICHCVLKRENGCVKSAKISADAPPSTSGGLANWLVSYETRTVWNSHRFPMICSCCQVEFYNGQFITLFRNLPQRHSLALWRIFQKNLISFSLLVNYCHNAFLHEYIAKINFSIKKQPARRISAHKPLKVKTTPLCTIEVWTFLHFFIFIQLWHGN
jgi:hypothetical protein